MELNLWRIFDAVSRSVPQREAVVAGRRRLRYGELAERSARLANVLAAHGLGARRPRAELAGWEIGQDTVGLYLLNCPEFLEGSLGGYAARTAPFNINYRYVPEELAYVLNDADTAALVYHARFAPTLAETLPLLRRTPLLLQVADDSGHSPLPGALDYEAALAAASAEAPACEPDPDDIFLLYTSGTTGMPKGTLWRQTDVWCALMSRDRFGAEAGPEDIAAYAAGHEHRLAPNAPLMHGAGQVTSLGALLSGGTVVLNGVVDHLDPVDFWRTVARERVTRTVFIGEAVARPLLTELEAEPGRYDVSSLGTVVNSGAPMSPETKQRLVVAVPGLRVVDMAGSSETGRSLQQDTSAGDQSDGERLFRPFPGVAVLDETRTRLLEPGHDGIGWFAKSGRLPLGYLGDRGKTEQTFLPVAGARYVVPGDRAQLTEDGLIRLLGREAAVINSGGEKIFAEEVEAALLAHPEVSDAVVIGRPSERWGQEAVAVIALMDGSALEDAELLATAEQRIARYKLPKAVVRVPAVRRSAAGKVDYAWARELVTAPTET
jgi:fatty-acyl-CoA synthase